MQPIDLRVIELLDVLVEERQEDPVSQRIAMEFLYEQQKLMMMRQEWHMHYLTWLIQH